MSQTASTISSYNNTISGAINVPIKSKVRLSAPTKEIAVLATILCLFQIADGILTGVGVANLGTVAEGNMFIRYLMNQIGLIPALVVCKSLAIAVIGLLCALSTSVNWLATAFKIIIGIYLTAAILPWTAVLFVHFS